MPISGMNHFTVLAKDLEATKAFYMGVLGLSEGFRPDLGFPGAWLYCGKEPVLHIIAGRALPADPRGVLDHMAFSAHDLRATTAKLKSSGIAPVSGIGSTVSSTVTAHFGLAPMLRALRASGEHENQKRSVDASHTPHTGIDDGRPAADAVTTQ